MNFRLYLLLFMTRSPVGIALTLAACLVDAILWRYDSPYYPVVLGISCLVILVTAFIAYTTDPQLRK